MDDLEGTHYFRKHPNGGFPLQNVRNYQRVIHLRFVSGKDHPHGVGANAAGLGPTTSMKRPAGGY